MPRSFRLGFEPLIASRRGSRFDGFGDSDSRRHPAIARVTRDVDRAEFGAHDRVALREQRPNLFELIAIPR